MKTSYHFLSCGLAATALFFTACTTSRQEYQISSSLIPVDAHWEKTPEPQMKAIVDKYKASVDSIMSIVIGQSDDYMAPGRPETTLTDLSADMIKVQGEKTVGEPVDFAVINIGGIRNPLMQGEITLGEIYSIFPFDNTLFLAKLKGSDVRELFNIIASRNGEAVSREVRMTIADGKATHIAIGGKPLDDNRIYTVATIDYVANGGDHMTPFLNAVERRNSPTFMRDAVINYICEETQAKRAISAPAQGRITISN